MKRITILLILLFIIIAAPKQVHAGFINGDESLGGFSYMMELAYTNTKPEGDYWKLFLLAESMCKDVYKVTDKEYEILCRIVEAEATGGDIKQKMNVASCVMARVESPSWADTIEGVVFEHYGNVYQFTPIVDGRYYSVTVTETTRKAVDAVIHDGKTHDCTWFCSDESYTKKDKNGNYTSYHRKHHTWVFFDGEHHYFYD